MTTLLHTAVRRVLAGALAALLAALAVVGVRAYAARRTAVVGLDPGLGAAVGAVIPGLEAFVEQARGLKFLSPVKVSVLGDAAFRRKVAEGNASGTDAPDSQSETLRVLGLVGGGGRPSSGDTLDPETVDGFYDSVTKELVVRGTRPTPFLRQVLVHELTHALDDQHFGLDPYAADDEATLADDALVEGDATVVEYRYVDSLSPEEQQAAADEEDASYGRGGSGGGGPSGPDPLADLADFPYTVGPDFIDALVAAGGESRVDAAFRAPPTTSAEILHPDRYLSGRARADVPPVVADGTVVDEGVVGEYLLRLVLAETVDTAEAERAASGWAGDHYVAWRSGRRTCVRLTVVLDSPDEAAELAASLRRWASDHRGATVGATSTVTLDRCA